MNANNREFLGKNTSALSISVHWRSFAVALALPAGCGQTSVFAWGHSTGAAPPAGAKYCVARSKRDPSARNARRGALQPRARSGGSAAARDRCGPRRGGQTLFPASRDRLARRSAGRRDGAWPRSNHLRCIDHHATVHQDSEPRPRTLRAKLIESATALRLEQLWSKDQILAAYLNRIDFGNLNIGLAAAADYYFDKPVADLSDAEAAFLAGLPKNPRRLNPHAALEAARQ